MVETSPTLAHAQYIRLRDEHPRVEWLDGLEQLPLSRTLVIANEFFDALPIKQYVMTTEGMCERRVGWSERLRRLNLRSPRRGLRLPNPARRLRRAR